MKTPTLEELKLAVAGMLPDKIVTLKAGTYPVRENGVITKSRESLFYWRGGDLDEVTEREWLHVCWLALNTLSDTELADYSDAAESISERTFKYCTGASRLKCVTHPDVQILALCRVKCPEMFTAAPLDPSPPANTNPDEKTSPWPPSC